jgi:hypothetical protein
MPLISDITSLVRGLKQFIPKLIPVSVIVVDAVTGAFVSLLAENITQLYENIWVPLPTVVGVEIMMGCPNPISLPPPVPLLVLNQTLLSEIQSDNIAGVAPIELYVPGTLPILPLLDIST